MTSHQDLFVFTWIVQRTGIQSIENRWEQELKHFHRADKFVKIFEILKKFEDFLIKQTLYETNSWRRLSGFKDKILRQYK